MRKPPVPPTRINSTQNTPTSPPRLTPPSSGGGSSGNKKSSPLTVILIILTLTFLGSSVVFLKRKVDLEKKLTEEKKELVRKFKALEVQLSEANHHNAIFQDSINQQAVTISSYISALEKERSISKSLVRYKRMYFASESKFKKLLKMSDSLVSRTQKLSDERNGLLEQLKSELVSKDSLKNVLLDIEKRVSGGSGKGKKKTLKGTKSKSLAIEGITIKPFIKKLGKEQSSTLRKATRLKVCVNVGEGRDVKPKNVKLFVKVVDPKGNVVGSNNKRAKYSASKKFRYTGESIPVCLYANRVKKFKKGRYKVSVMDGNMKMLSVKNIPLK